ncbi:MAG: hypothetical protein CMC55_04660 [Flavobacteriaceae bacterium]|nr:hypothetical protein [Flavobacteriaceae bacterium]
MKYEILEIGEHKLACRFGFNALRKYSLRTGATMNDLNKLASGEVTFNDAFSLIYCGIEDGHRAAKQPFKLSLDEVTDLFDGNTDSMEKAFEILGRAMGEGNEKKPKAKRAKKS